MQTMLLAAMDSPIIVTAVPQIAADRGGFSLISWVFSSNLLLRMVCIPIYGKLADVNDLQWAPTSAQSANLDASIRTPPSELSTCPLSL